MTQPSGPSPVPSLASLYPSSVAGVPRRATPSPLMFASSSSSIGSSSSAGLRPSTSSSSAAVAVGRQYPIPPTVSFPASSLMSGTNAVSGGPSSVNSHSSILSSSIIDNANAIDTSSLYAVDPTIRRSSTMMMNNTATPSSSSSSLSSTPLQSLYAPSTSYRGQPMMGSRNQISSLLSSSQMSSSSFQPSSSLPPTAAPHSLSNSSSSHIGASSAFASSSHLSSSSSSASISGASSLKSPSPLVTSSIRSFGGVGGGGISVGTPTNSSMHASNVRNSSGVNIGERFQTGNMNSSASVGSHMYASSSLPISSPYAINPGASSSLSLLSASLASTPQSSSSIIPALPIVLPYHVKSCFDIGHPLNAITHSPDRSLLAVGGKELRILSHVRGQFALVKNLNTQRVAPTTTALADIQWHPHESCKQYLLAAPTTGKIILYNLPSKDGLRKPERIFDDHERTVNRIVWHTTSLDTLLSGSQDGTVKMFDLRNSTSKAVQVFADMSSVRDVQVNPFNSSIFCAGYETGSIHIWDTRSSAKYFHTMNAHQGLILALDWHPLDQDILASGGVDKAIKVWHVGAQAEKSILGGIHSTPAGADGLTPSASFSSNANSFTASSTATHQTDPLHTISTIASVGRIKWRPSFSSSSSNGSTSGAGGKFNFHIASAASTTECKIHVWNVHKPFVPVVSLSGPKDIITGMYFCDVDSGGGRLPGSANAAAMLGSGGMEMVSCSKDGHVQQHYLNVDVCERESYTLTSYPAELLRTSALSWNVRGSIATANDYIDRTNTIALADPPSAMPFSFTASSPGLLSSSTVASRPSSMTVPAVLSASTASLTSISSTLPAPPRPVTDALRNGFIRIFHSDDPVVNPAAALSGARGKDGPPSQSLSDEDAFVYFASHYRFTSNESFSSHLLHSHAASVSPPPASDFATLAIHNSNVARSVGQHELSQMWLMFAQLLGAGAKIAKVVLEGPPPLPMDDAPASVIKARIDSNRSHPPTSITHVQSTTINPSTVLHHRMTTSPLSSSSAFDDGRDNLVDEYLQVVLVNADHPSTSHDDHRSGSNSHSRMVSDSQSIQSDASITSAPTSSLSTSVPPSQSSMSPLKTPSSNAESTPNDAAVVNEPASLNRSQILIDCLPTIHKSHCYTLQSPTHDANHHHLSSMSTTAFNPFGSSLSILCSSSFQSQLLNNFLSRSIDRGDVQTCVALISLLKEFHPQVIASMDAADQLATSLAMAGDAVGHSLNDRFKHWYYSYIDLLQRHELYSHAGEIIQLCNDSDLKKMNQKSTTIALICPVCKHASQATGIGCTSKMCTKTRMTNCSICQLPVSGVYVWCQGCGHGGHIDHMNDWFKEHSYCATGCLHRCTMIIGSAR